MLPPGLDASNFLIHHLMSILLHIQLTPELPRKLLKVLKILKFPANEDAGNCRRDEFHQAGRRHSPLCNTLIIKNQLF